jgi:hypothetical protein
MAEARLKLISRKLVLAVIAGIACLIAVSMLNLAAYLALITVVSKPLAALIVAVINLVIAGLLVAIAQGLQPGPEEEMLREVRDIALGDLGSEVDDVQAQLLQLREDVEGMRASVTQFVQRPLDALSPTMIMPALSAIAKFAKSKKT